MLSIKQERWIHDFGPVDSECNCKVCRTYSRSYLRHLFKEQEILSSILASYHNLYFLNNMLKEIRLAIDEGFPVSIATTGDGISGPELERLMDLGVTEFTVDHHCSMGLNW